MVNIVNVYIVKTLQEGVFSKHNETIPVGEEIAVFQVEGPGYYLLLPNGVHRLLLVDPTNDRSTFTAGSLIKWRGKITRTPTPEELEFLTPLILEKARAI